MFEEGVSDENEEMVVREVEVSWSCQREMAAGEKGLEARLSQSCSTPIVPL